MKIGFVQDKEDIKDVNGVGFIDPAMGEASDEDGYTDFIVTVLFHYFMVNGMIDIVRDLVEFFWGS